MCQVIVLKSLSFWHLFNHPSTFHHYLVPFRAVAGWCWSLSQLSWVRGWVTLGQPPIHYRATFKTTTIYAHIHNYGQFRVAGSPPLNAWKLAYPERTHADTGRTCKLHKGRPLEDPRKGDLLMWGSRANDCMTVPPWIKQFILNLPSWHWGM